MRKNPSPLPKCPARTGMAQKEAQQKRSLQWVMCHTEDGEAMRANMERKH